jgi:hypothetical protein
MSAHHFKSFASPLATQKYFSCLPYRSRSVVSRRPVRQLLSIPAVHGLVAVSTPQSHLLVAETSRQDIVVLPAPHACCTSSTFFKLPESQLFAPRCFPSLCVGVTVTHTLEISLLVRIARLLSYSETDSKDKRSFRWFVLTSVSCR